jgi:hypothetical protein
VSTTPIVRDNSVDAELMNTGDTPPNVLPLSVGPVDEVNCFELK